MFIIISWVCISLNMAQYIYLLTTGDWSENETNIFLIALSSRPGKDAKVIILEDRTLGLASEQSRMMWLAVKSAKSGFVEHLKREFILKWFSFHLN